MKKILALTLVVMMAFTMVACGSKLDQKTNESVSEDKENTVAEEVAESKEEVEKEEDTTEKAEEKKTTEAAEEVTEEVSEEASEEVTEEAEEVAEEKQEEAKEEKTEEEKVTEEANEETNKQAAEETKEEVTEEVAKETTEPPAYEYKPIDVLALDDTNRPVVTITFQEGEKIVLKLVPEVAPNTVNSFVTSIQDGFYDGLVFHRIIKDFMIQGGDPDGTGAGGPGFTISDEFFVIDDLTVTYLSHAKGIISMAKTQAPHSAGSQFFITHGESTFLDGGYASFGFVTEGIEVVDQFAIVETGANDKPVVDVVIKTITVELNGYELVKPVRN